MGCKPSTTANNAVGSNNNNNNPEEVLAKRYKENLKGIGQTERQISKMQREAMNNDETDGNIVGANKNVRNKLAPKLDSAGFLAPEEVAKRTFSSISNKDATLGAPKSTTHMQFAHWTQRGYYPDDPHKQNQDEFGTHLQFAGVAEDAMLAVYDGHGKHGHSCAQFARERLPKAVAKQVRKVRCNNYQRSRGANKKGGWDPTKWPMLNKSEYETCCRKAFLEVNQAMHDTPNVMDTFSGTTATTVCFHGNFISVSNVGDSRVVLGHRVKDTGDNSVAVNYPMHAGVRARPVSPSAEEEKNEIDDELVEESFHAVASPVRTPGGAFHRRRQVSPGTRVLAIPLSKDQTPYRKDERERVQAHGASVMSIDQMQGKEEVHDKWGDLILGQTLDIEGDSPRVWMKGKDYPGCAFTRSLGDSMSESVGVNAVPEILSTELTQNDEYLVIASDGIFEFLTNQVVMDFCASSESPLVACEKIVKAAYEQWLTYEKRTDDITLIVCFLQSFRAPPLDGRQGTTEDLVQSVATMYGDCPLHMSSPEMPLSVSVTPINHQSSPVRAKKDTTSMLSIPRFEEGEAVAYVSEEAQAVIVRIPPPPMTFDNTDTVEVKIDSLMEEVNNMDNATSKTVSITSTDDDDRIMAESEHKCGDTASSAAEARNTIQI